MLIRNSGYDVWVNASHSVWSVVDHNIDKLHKMQAFCDKTQILFYSGKILTPPPNTHLSPSPSVLQLVIDF